MANKASTITLKTKVKGADKGASQVTKLTTAIAGLAAGYVGVKTVMKGISFIKSTGDAYMNLRTTISRLDVMFQKLEKNNLLTSKGWKQASKSAQQYANELQKVTGIAASDIMVGQATLASYQLTEKAVRDLTQGMVDMATNSALMAGKTEVAAYQMSDAANLISKGMLGQPGMLRRAGIAVNKYEADVLKTGTAVEKAAMMVQVLDNNVSGVSREMRKTTKGSMMAMKTAFTALKERAGEWFEAMKPIFNKLTKFFDSDKAKNWASSFAGVLGRIIEKLTDVAERLLGIKINPEIDDEKLINPKNYSWQGNKEGASKAKTTMKMVESGRLDNKSANKIIEMLASQDFKGANAAVKENLAPKKTKEELKQDEAKKKGEAWVDNIAKDIKEFLGGIEKINKAFNTLKTTSGKYIEMRKKEFSAFKITINSVIKPIKQIIKPFTDLFGPVDEVSTIVALMNTSLLTLKVTLSPIVIGFGLLSALLDTLNGVVQFVIGGIAKAGAKMAGWVFMDDTADMLNEIADESFAAGNESMGSAGTDLVGIVDNLKEMFGSDSWVSGDKADGEEGTAKTDGKEGTTKTDIKVTASIGKDQQPETKPEGGNTDPKPKKDSSDVANAVKEKDGKQTDVNQEVIDNQKEIIELLKEQQKILKEHDKDIEMLKQSQD